MSNQTTAIAIETGEIPADWLVEVVRLLDKMAIEGVCIADQSDPADLVVDLAHHLGCPNDGNLTDHIIKSLTGGNPS
jgi:hypothetical protein